MRQPWRPVPANVLLNVGLPMLAVAWPAYWIALLPVVAIEALIARRLLGLPTLEAFALSGKANVVSTLIGIPIAWVALVALEMVMGFAVSPFELDAPIGTVVLFPFMSAWIFPTEDIRLVYIAFVISSRPRCLTSGAPQARAESLHLQRAPTAGPRRLNAAVGARSYIRVNIGRKGRNNVRAEANLGARDRSGH